MGQHNITRISVYLIFIFSIVLFSTIAYAKEAPILPAFFYGQATVNGRDVPVNSRVIARINNEKRGEITVDAAGEYGHEVGDSKLSVVGNSSDIGEEIEFYVKLPGVQEIKAEQVSQWQTSSVNNLDLTFTGEEVPEPDDNDGGGGSGGGSVSGGSGGGSGGGGGGGAGSAQSGTSFYYDLIEAGKQISISLTNGILIKLQLILNNNAEAVDFDFDEFDSINAPELGAVYKYISITAPEITDDNVKTAIIKFKIANEWFEEGNYDPEKVVLLRYTDQWDELETVHEGSDAGHNYYRAGTPGFTYFAIKSEKAENKKPESKRSDDKKSEDGVGLGEITGAVVGAIGSIANPVIGFAIIFIIVIVGVSIYIFVTKK